MSSKVKNAVFQKKIEGEIFDLLMKSSVKNVLMEDETTTLAAWLANTVVGKFVTPATLEARVAEIIGAAPQALDTLGEIADKLAENDDLHDLVQQAIAGKVDKDGDKGLSEEDFTSLLKAKLESLQNYTHPATHSAEMIEETADRKFVTAAEKTKIAESGRILVGDVAPADLTPQDLFVQILPDTEEE